MAEEIKTSPDIAPDSNKIDVEPVTEETPETGAQPATAVGATKKGDPWKTAFIVLAGITVISGGIYFTTYGRKSDLPTVPTTDPNAMPVQMANPPTGASEQSALRQPLPTVVGNAADMQAMPGGGYEYDPWANPGRYQSNSSSNPYPVTPVGPPGQQVYMETNPNSPFMSDGNTYVMVPANTAVNANRGGAANTNRPPKPVTSPSPGTAVPAANTAPATTQPKPDTQPANKPPVKPKKPTTGKPNGTE